MGRTFMFDNPSFFSDKNLSYPGFFRLGVVAAVAIIIYANSFNAYKSKLLANRVLVWFGLISFPLYLYHWPLLSFLEFLQTIALAFYISVLYWQFQCFFLT